MNYDIGKLIYKLRQLKMAELNSVPLTKQDEIAKWSNKAWNKAIDECIETVKEELEHEDKNKK